MCRICAFRSTATENRPTIIFDDVKNARISGLPSTSVNGGQPIVKLLDSSDVWISDSAGPLQPRTFVEVAGAGCGNILVLGCDLRSVGKAVEAIGDAPKNAATAR